MKYSKSSTDFILIDTKNYASISAIFKGSNIDQLKAYLTAISSMNKLKIIQANRSSFGANTALTTLKKNLQKVYRDNTDDFFDIFYDNVKFREEIFGSSTILEVQARANFNTIINIDLSNNTHVIYNLVELRNL